MKIYVGRRITNVAGAEPKKNKPCEGNSTAGRSPSRPARSSSPPTRPRRSTTGWASTPSRPRIARTWLGLKVPRGSVDDVLYWDNEDPYHYVRLEATDAADRTRRRRQR